MGDCQARFREGLGCDSPAYSIRPFHHDRGRLVFAVSPRRGEQGALGKPSGWMLLRERRTAFGRDERPPTCFA